MSIFKAMESLVANLKLNFKEYTEAYETKQQNTKHETKEELLKLYKAHVTKENVATLHDELMKHWNEIDLLVLDSPKLVELNDVEKTWVVYPLETEYLEWTFVAKFKYEIRNWDNVDDCTYSKAFKDYMESGKLRLHEKILLVKK